MSPMPVGQGKLFAAVALAEALRLNVFGAGTPTDPLTGAAVQLTQTDGNALAIMAAVDRATRQWARQIPGGRYPDQLRQIRDGVLYGVREELLSSKSYDDLLARVCCLVTVT